MAGAQNYEAVIDEMMSKYGAELVHQNWVDDSFDVRCNGKPDLRITRQEVEDNLHHKILMEWSSGQKSSS